MENYRLWFVRDSVGVRGPYPEALVCRYLVLGRLDKHDEVSLDGHTWRQAGEVPELAKTLKVLLNVPVGAASEDPQWSEERAKAAVRWLDDRKSPDPRGTHMPEGMEYAEMRSGNERRQGPETVDQLVHREFQSEATSRTLRGEQSYGKIVAIVLTLLVLAVVAMSFSWPGKTFKIGLNVAAVDCEALPARGVRWGQCIKDGELLVGADLRDSELVGASLKYANLSYADLSGANLLNADLTGANLTGTNFTGAIWVDGRFCPKNSVGRCL